MKFRIMFVLLIIFLVGCMTTNTYHIDKLQIFFAEDGKQFFVLEKENIKAKTDKKLNKTFKQLRKEFDAMRE